MIIVVMIIMIQHKWLAIPPFSFQHLQTSPLYLSLPCITRYKVWVVDCHGSSPVSESFKSSSTFIALHHLALLSTVSVTWCHWPPYGSYLGAAALFTRLQIPSNIRETVAPSMVDGLQPEPLCFVSNCVEQWNWYSGRINENAFDKSIMAPSCISEGGSTKLHCISTLLSSTSSLYFTKLHNAPLN